MKPVPLTEFRRRLSFYLAKVKRGETIIISERDIPVAKLVPLTTDERGRK